MQFLSRGPVEGSYVRTDQQTGSTEITLKTGKKEVTIRRELIAGQRGGVFYMNGVKKTSQEIEKFVKSQNIVLENFCNVMYEPFHLFLCNVVYVFTLSPFPATGCRKR